MQSCANPDCSNEFESTDSRKIYCSRACQISNNNERAREQRERFQEVNWILKRNHALLEDILGDEEQTEISRALLKEEGFDFFTFTGIAKVKGIQMAIIYDKGFVKLNDSTYQIHDLNGND